MNCPPSRPPSRPPSCPPSRAPRRPRAKQRTAPRLPLGEAPLRPSFRRERAAMKRGIFPVAGCDEAGPRAARRAGGRRRRHPGLQADSARPRRFQEAHRCASAKSFTSASARPRRSASPSVRARASTATTSGRPRCGRWRARSRRCRCGPSLVFVDGSDRIEAGCDCEAVISGDALVLSIAAASIVAKVVRDRLMMQVGAAHPGYGFERHMGYSVPEHFRALTPLGPTVHHRRGFAPVAAAFGDRDEAAVPPTATTSSRRSTPPLPATELPPKPTDSAQDVRASHPGKLSANVRARALKRCVVTRRALICAIAQGRPAACSIPPSSSNCCARSRG